MTNTIDIKCFNFLHGQRWEIYLCFLSSFLRNENHCFTARKFFTPNDVTYPMNKQQICQTEESKELRKDSVCKIT